MKNLIELDKMYHLQRFEDDLIRSEVLAEVEVKGSKLPILCFRVGPDDPTLPVFGIVAGVHGLERIGSHVAISYLESLFEQMQWDQDLRSQFKDFRIIAIPVLNPGGMALTRRSNPNHVDLMRNAPIEAIGEAPPLVSGHRISPRLPWYRGELGKGMELEAQTLVDLMVKEVFPAAASMVIDIHSGFGMRDRLWYPYAKTKLNFPKIKEALSFKRLFDKTFPHHIYIIEGQSENYITHGDLWDYLVDEFEKQPDAKERFFLPWTLEMGSWMWIRKNPGQFFSKAGLFNPIKQHRYSRIMRRHLLLLEFMSKASRHFQSWRPQ